MKHSTRSLVVVTAGLSRPSASRLLADRLGAAVDAVLAKHEIAAVVEVVELREYARDLSDHLVTGFPSPALRSVLESVTGADAVIAVTPIFSASYSGLFKMFFDALEDSALRDKPVLIAATAGTARHSLVLEHAMRPLFAYLHAVVVPTAVFAASEDWGATDRTGGTLSDRIARAAAELAALVAAREPVAPVDPFDDPTPFEQLIAGG